MKDYNVKVYKIAGEATVTVAADSADAAAQLALDKSRELTFVESSRKYEAEAEAVATLVV